MSRRVARSDPSAARGVALLMVLWVIALLSALVAAFALVARVESMQGRSAAAGGQADEAARAGLEYALSRVADRSAAPGRAWRPDGRPYTWQFGDAAVTVAVVDESGKVDLNMADAPLLDGLLRATGAEQAAATRLAGAIVDWRDRDALSGPAGGAEDGDYAAAGLPYGAKDAPFESVGELRLVLGMDGVRYDAIAPFVTVDARRARPDPRWAAGPVLTALGLDATALLAQRGGVASAAPMPGAPEEVVAAGTGTYSVHSVARLRDGREGVLRAVVRMGGNGLPGSAYAPLRWEPGAAPR